MGRLTTSRFGGDGMPVLSVSSYFCALAVALTAALSPGAAAAAPNLVAAVLPVARAAQLNHTVTALATVINSGDTTATGCSIAVPPGRPVTFTYRTIAPNGTLGPVNTPVNIPAFNASQNFLMTFTPTMSMGANLALVFDCTNSNPAPSVSGLNTFLLTGTTFAPADLISTMVTPTHNGILTVTVNQSGAAAAAAINIGTSATLQARAQAFAPGSPAATLPGTLSICRTNPNGTCVSPPTTDPLTFASNANATATFSVFFQSNGTTIPFDPANKRVFINFFQNLGTTTVGSASVAIRTQLPPRR